MTTRQHNKSNQNQRPYIFVAAILCNDMTHPTTQRRPRILLGISGSVAAVKGPELALRLYNELGADVIIVLTQTGERFWKQSERYNGKIFSDLQAIITKQEQDFLNQGLVPSDNYLLIKNVSAATNPNHLECSSHRTLRIHRYNDEWIGSNSIYDQEEILSLKNNPVIWEQVGDPILHIQLRQWADLALVAPLSAHTLAKLSNGLCDDLLSCTLRAWDFSNMGTQAGLETTASSCHRATKPILLAPAMNTAMWDHPITKKQLEYICSWGSDLPLTKNEPNVYKDDDAALHSTIVRVIPPQVKKLACGDHGNGALADLSDILSITKEFLCNSGFHNYFFKDV